MNDRNRTDAAVADKIEQRIDRDIAGGIEVAGTGGAISIVPRDMGELMEFAKMLSLSGPCIRKDFRNRPGSCLAVTMQAMRWGMDPIAVANKAYIVNDQLAYESQLVHAVVNERAPLQKRLRPRYEGEGQTRKCIITGYLTGDDESFDYESPMIKDIKPQNSPLWKNDPDQQLFYFSVRSWARRHVPEVLLGVYTDDEVQETRRPGDAVDITPPKPTRDALAAPQKQDADEPEVPDYEFVDRHGEVSTVYHISGQYLEAVKVEIERCEGNHNAVIGVFEHNEGTMAEAITDATDRQVMELYGPIERAHDTAVKALADAGNAKENQKKQASQEKVKSSPPPASMENSQPAGENRLDEEQVEASPNGDEKEAVVSSPGEWKNELPYTANGEPNWLKFYSEIANLAGKATAPEHIDALRADNADDLVSMSKGSKTHHAQLMKLLTKKRGDLS